MRTIKTLAAVAMTFAVLSSAAYAIEPIPGSIIYNGQPRSKLTKAPIGSTFEHLFRDSFGDRYVETYRIAPDRSLQLLSRHKIDIFQR
ncbi:hypothetical protein GB927_007610 [Shinella sp. CPCC 100929]|uniref:Uncharacterized protein n=1 Tax=Shinella lacus TaxID=2654216 RepID=A0ABT1R404_9HYPH|nr:hypothetical protein [Shinella lacus]MCQ4629895.1 hypothetical protein [Shinella lacus]